MTLPTTHEYRRKLHVSKCFEELAALEFNEDCEADGNSLEDHGGQSSRLTNAVDFRCAVPILPLGSNAMSAIKCLMLISQSHGQHHFRLSGA